jgi:uncharacterized protein
MEITIGGMGNDCEIVSEQSELTYFEGEGVPQDYTGAVCWFRKAAEQGVAQAQLLLGSSYCSGKGVPQDYVEAHMWLNLAASHASGDLQRFSTEARDSVARKMTAQQISDAQRLAREWKPKTK